MTAIPEQLATRLQDLVDVRYPDSAKRAAAEIGIPTTTLHLILTGKSKSPRARTLHRIALHFGTSMEWLLEGTGPLPEILAEDLPLTQTLALLKSLRLSPTDSRVVLSLGEWVRSVSAALRTDERVGDLPRSASGIKVRHAKRQNVSRHFDTMLKALLEAFIEEWGAERAREQLTSRSVRTRLAVLGMPLEAYESMVAPLGEAGEKTLAPRSPSPARGRSTR